MTGKYAEDMAASLEAGNEVLVDGKLRYRAATDKGGQKTGWLVVSTWFVTKASPMPTPTLVSAN